MRAIFTKLVILAGFCAFILSGQARAEAVIGQPAPVLTATMLDGKKFDLAALKGKIIVVHFWATWCAPCREEMPALEAVWREYRGKGMEVLAISGDRPRARGDVDQVMHYFSFPAALFSDLGKNDFGTPPTVPVTYVIDKEGVVHDIITPDVQPLTQAALGGIVKSLLDAKPEVKPEVKPEAKDDAKPDEKK
jgi:peroxiredoxin